MSWHVGALHESFPRDAGEQEKDNLFVKAKFARCATAFRHSLPSMPIECACSQMFSALWSSFTVNYQRENWNVKWDADLRPDATYLWRRGHLVSGIRREKSIGIGRLKRFTRLFRWSTMILFWFATEGTENTHSDNWDYCQDRWDDHDEKNLLGQHVLVIGKDFLLDRFVIGFARWIEVLIGILSDFDMNHTDWTMHIPLALIADING